jgi:hypothetical protein
VVRRKSGWDDPMLVNSISAQVEAAWNAAVDDKRRLEDTHMEDSQGREKQQQPEPISTCSRQEKKEVRFQSDEASSQQPSQASISKDQAKPKKSEKKGPGYLLARDVETTIEGDGLAEKFW